MKKHYVLYILILFFSCKKNDNTTPTNPTPKVKLPTVSTQNPTGIFSAGVTFNGTVITEGTEPVHTKGFCWSNNTNPTKQDNVVYADGSGTGSFSKVSDHLSANTTYNVRAFAESNAGLTYGNNITFKTANIYSALTTSVTDILPFSATVNGSIISLYSTIYKVGVCYSLTPNPTITNSSYTYFNTTTPTAVGDYSVVISQLNKTTTYYVRFFGIDVNSNVYYGNDLTVTTMGNAGTSGGYIFYDKGFVSNGWRYLEAGPEDLKYNSSYGIEWGCNSTRLYANNYDIGYGLENTNKITTYCSSANCAARICSDYSINGLNDWFLGTIYDMELLSKSNDLFLFPNSAYWTSTENSDLSAQYIILYDGHYSILDGAFKFFDYRVRPIRKF